MLKGSHALPAEDRTDVAPIAAWLRSFAEAVRAVDFARGRSLFDPDVVAFGTRGRVLYGLDMLESQQWRKIWPVTRGYHLDECGGAVAGQSAWAIATWRSEGIAADGAVFARSGRASFVYRRDGSRWLAVHSHHSMDPSNSDGLARP